MTRVLLIVSNLQQPACRLRWQQILPYLALQGIEVDMRVRPRGVAGRYRLMCSADRYDWVVIQRKMLPAWEARTLRRHARRVAMDIDDATMYGSRYRGWWHQWMRKRWFDATTRILDLAVVGNDYLREVFASQGCQCAYLPTTVDPAHYQVKQHAAGEVVRLVWIGSHSALPYLAACLPVLEALHQKPIPLELITIADKTVRSSRITVRHIPWSLDAEAVALVQGDIGIAPTLHDRWSRGKCGFKIIQYMTAGLPVIASPVGANAVIVRHGITGLLAESQEEWGSAVARLAADVTLRTSMGTAGRQVVENEYSLSRAVDFWCHTFRDEQTVG